MINGSFLKKVKTGRAVTNNAENKLLHTRKSFHNGIGYVHTYVRTFLDTWDEIENGMNFTVRYGTSTVWYRTVK